MNAVTLAQHFQQMARYNAWANARLMNACLALSPDAFAAPRIGFFPSIQETLNHLLIVDWFYLDAFEGGGLGREVQRNAVPFPDAADLAPARSDADRRLIAFCDGLGETGLQRRIVKETDGVDHTETIGALLAHSFVHQTHHRGQAHGMLSATAVPPPQLDEFFLAADAQARTSELGLLGIADPGPA